MAEVIHGHHGAAILKLYPRLGIVNLKTESGIYECEIELTKVQARTLGEALIGFSDCIEMERPLKEKDLL
jgi:hypothetical protein